MEPVTREPRISVVDALRGLAALAIFFHHWNWAPFDCLKGYGRLGVPVFFVISGFVIPYALSRSAYQIKSYGSFVLKRLLRLDPPYIASILLILALEFGRYWIHYPNNKLPDISLPQVLLHLGYINAFFGYPWLNGVYWTLAIEFQYYLILGLIFPLVSHRDPRIRGAAAIGLGVLAFVFPQPEFVFHYFFLFLVGLAAFNFYAGLLNTRWFLAMLCAFTAGVYLNQGAADAIAAAMTAGCICWLKVRNPVLTFLGSISYSLYLIHLVIGWHLYVIVSKLPLGSLSEPLRPYLALVSCIGVTYIFYRLVELPAIRWSSAIRYGGRDRRIKETPSNVMVAEPAQP